MPRSPLPGADLIEVVRTALLHEGHLFAAGECVLLRRILALHAEPLELLARLALRAVSAQDADPVSQARSPAVFRISTMRYAPEVVAAADALVDQGFLHVDASDADCLPAFDVSALRAACARLGLPVTGGRSALQARLAPHAWRTERVVVFPHTRLFARVDLLCFGGRADRGHLVAERMGMVRWARYEPTGGTGLFARRGALLAYERARRGEWSDAEEPLRIVRAGPRGFGPCAWRRAVEHVLASGPDADTIGTLVHAGARVRPAWARALLAEGRHSAAYAVCAQGAADLEEAFALARVSRAVARACRRGFAPAPLEEVQPDRLDSVAPRARPVRERRLVMRSLGRSRGRPVYADADGGPARIEQAALSLLRAAGRRALHAENGLWRSLYALVFRDLYWMAVPGMLPGPRRSGPLDVGTPGFHLRRRAAVEARLTELAARGPGPFARSWAGERLAGLGDPAQALAWADAVPGPLAEVVLGRLAREGWVAARGLPDLFVAEGNDLRIEGAIPAIVEKSAFFAEIKGPSDGLSDAQRAWLSVLSRAGIHVEIWNVTETCIM